MAIQLHVALQRLFPSRCVRDSNNRQVVLEIAPGIPAVLGVAVILGNTAGRIEQAGKLQALSGRKLAPRQRMIPASFSALGRASQAFADHQLGNIAAFRL
jgi:hypothetical protein